MLNLHAGLRRGCFSQVRVRVKRPIRSTATALTSALARGLPCGIHRGSQPSQPRTCWEPMRIGTILFVPILAAAYKSIALNMHPRTPSELYIRFVMTQINGSLNMKLSQQVYNAACSTWYGGYMVLVHYIHKARFRHQQRPRIAAMLIYPWLLLELLFDLATPPLFSTNIVVNEINLMKTRLSYDEEVASVGQWSPKVSATLVVLAAIINKGMRTYRARKRRKDIPEQVEEPREHLEEEKPPTHAPRYLARYCILGLVFPATYEAPGNMQSAILTKDTTVYSLLPKRCG